MSEDFIKKKLLDMVFQSFHFHLQLIQEQLEADREGGQEELLC